MKKRTTKLSFLGRYIGSLLLGILIVGSGFLVYFTIIFPSITSSPWTTQLLIIETIVLPLVCFSIYLMFRLFLTPFTGKTFVKQFRQWIAVFTLVYCYSLSLVFFAFLFEKLTPFLPLFYKGIFLPLVINLILILIFTRTPLRPKFERFLKRLFYGSTAQNEENNRV